jgi:hypothetical protein
MIEPFSWINNRNIQTLSRFFLFPVALLAAIFVPPLLLSFLLTFVLIIHREISSLYSLAAPLSLCINRRIALKPRSPPSR